MAKVVHKSYNQNDNLLFPHCIGDFIPANDPVRVLDAIVERLDISAIEAIGTKYKVRHRAEFGISVVRKYWGLGIGKALLTSCIECAKTAGYNQLELKVVAENERAVSMYERAGFVECGRNPKGFRSRIVGFQEVISMRLEL